MKNLVYLLLLCLFVSACESPKEKAIRHITGLEAADSIFSPQHVEALKTAYLDFAEKYPDDELAPEFMFKAAQRCNVMAQHEEALHLFQEIIVKYPKSHISEEALFLQGYIYENSLQDTRNAKRVYTEFLEKYPKSDLAEDARSSIENLGKSPEEIFESFNKKDSVQ